ncbi:hypothetical protein U472_12480 [Orenia metallireducens]|uniref:Solute-binding protein family 3/N-terminal domain-containing protein n=1 Tax=Orenia metallireducens TaxID=1413210 RepID=A0A1C0A4W6_9FIRM|nr:ABC transporter substrate-binding protein [Orenia metallireducens]OCL25180.1 hypothetical protein U472_12480 [Orenia metallireducens]
MNKIRVILMACLVMILMVISAACSSPSNEQVTSSKAVDEKRILDEIQSRGKIIIGINASAPPFTFRDTDGELTGMTVELGRLIGERMGVEVEFVDMDWAGLIPSLLSERIDLIGDRMSNTLERAKSVAFTDSYLKTGTVAYVRDTSSLSSADDVRGKDLKVGVLLGSIQEEVATEQLPTAEIIPLQTNPDIKSALLSNRVEVALDDEIIAYEQVQQAPDKLKILSGFLVVDTYSFAVRHEDDDLRLWVNLFFEKIKREGEFAKIYKKWLGKEWSPEAQKQL